MVISECKHLIVEGHVRMQTDIMKQFNMSRDTLMKSIRYISETDADSMPNYDTMEHWSCSYFYRPNLRNYF